MVCVSSQTSIVIFPWLCLLKPSKPPIPLHPTPTREAGTTIIEIQHSIEELKPAKWVKLDTSLVGDNNNKGTAPNLFIYKRLLLITPTRAVLFVKCFIL
jgi:hypothetical protein